MKITQAITILSAVVLAAGCAHEEHHAQYDESISPYASDGTPRYRNNNDTVSLNGPGTVTVVGGSYSSPGGKIIGPTAVGGSTSGSASGESDDAIVTSARESLERDPEIASIVPKLQITSYNGIVDVSGPVQSEAQKRQIDSLIRKVGGVSSVNNQLKVSSNGEQGENRTGMGGSEGTANQGTESGGAVGRASGENQQNSLSPGSTNNMGNASQNPLLNPTSATNNSPSKIYQNSTNGVSNGELNPTSTGTNTASHIYQEPGMQNTGTNALNPTSRTNGESQIYQQPNPEQNNQLQNTNRNSQNP